MLHIRNNFRQIRLIVALAQQQSNLALTGKSALYKLRFGQIRHTYTYIKQCQRLAFE